MSVVSMKQLLEAGVHFGHQAKRWNPKMAKYIFTERNGIHVIDLHKSLKKIEEASGYLRIVLFAYTLGSMPFALKRNAKYDIDGTRNYSCQKRSLKHVGVW